MLPPCDWLAAGDVTAGSWDRVMSGSNDRPPGASPGLEPLKIPGGVTAARTWPRPCPAAAQSAPAPVSWGLEDAGPGMYLVMTGAFLGVQRSDAEPRTVSCSPTLRPDRRTEQRLCPAEPPNFLPLCDTLLRTRRSGPTESDR